MKTVFVQWVLGQFIIAKVEIPANYYVEIEIIYPYPGIKAEYFTEDDDLTDKDNFGIIKTFISRTVEVYLNFTHFPANLLSEKAQYLSGEASDPIYQELVWNSIEEKVTNGWWGADDMKFFSRVTIENLANTLKYFLNTGQSAIRDLYIYEDRTKTIQRMRDAALQQETEEIYVYLCDRRFNGELNEIHKKIVRTSNKKFSHDLEVAITESSYSYPDLCSTTESPLLKKEFQNLRMDEKNFHYSTYGIEGAWTPYRDIAHEYFTVRMSEECRSSQ